MTYKEPLPPGCPPEAAEEIASARAVFRLVRANPPSNDDFLSQRAEKPNRAFSGVDECQARGLSVFGRRGDAERANLLPNLRDRLLCRVQLLPGAGRIHQTGQGSHHTWWPLAAYDILASCHIER